MIIDPRYFEYLGIPAGDCTLTNEQFAQMVHPDDIEGVITALTLTVHGSLIETPVSYRLGEATDNGNGSRPNPLISVKEHKLLSGSLVSA